MKSKALLALAGAVLLLASVSSAARGASPDEPGGAQRTFACPIGGKPFEQSINYPALALVQFPDGSWLGDHLIDAQLPECPKDGLVLIPDFESKAESSDLAYPPYTPQQVARLAALVGTDEYRALRKRGRYERAEWIARQLGLPAYTRLQLLMRATWATVEAAERKRIVARLASEGPSLIEQMTRPPYEKLALRLRVANALRELGRFEEAEAELDAIGAAIPKSPDIADLDAANELGGAVASMREVVAARDDDRFPVDLVSARWASQMCSGNDLPPPYGPLTAKGRAACERRKAHRQALDDEFAAADALLKDPAALDRRCDATPPNRRDAGLANACRSRQDERDRVEGHRMLAEQPAQVAAQCEAIPAMDREGAISSACSGYETSLESALGQLLVDDDAAYTIICNDGRDPPDRAGFATLACATAGRERNERAVAQRMKDLPALDAACAATSPQDRELILYTACGERTRNLHQLAAERLAADAAAYRSQCAAFDARPADSGFRTAYSDAESQCAEARRISERAKEPAAAVRPAQPEPDLGIWADDSPLSQVAREYARRVIAKAKAEGTYPKRKRGDLY